MKNHWGPMKNHWGTDEKSLGTDEKSLGTDEKSLGTNEKSLGTDEKSLGTDEKSLRTDEKSFCTNIPVVGAMHSGKVLASPPKLNGRIHRPWANCRIPGQRLWLHRLKTLPDSPTSQPSSARDWGSSSSPSLCSSAPKTVRNFPASGGQQQATALIQGGKGFGIGGVPQVIQN